ncbi:MAG: radical SAM family heme chaperone HemW [Actinobacteria bacterium]|nr:radical SAM family heme chaperone HemW [Actinomycetota bacterium]
MTPETADAFANHAAAYVHIPFCSAVCPYCDFAVVAGRDDLTERYVAALCAEIMGSEPWRPVQALYVGGGTPSRLDPGLLAMVLDAVERRHGIAGDAEVSLEANPEDFGPNFARTLRAIGFNRVSFGAQSFSAPVLSRLGRRHDAAQIEHAVLHARRSGFTSVSLDLIFGTPGESLDSWQHTVERTVALEPDHVSCYALTVERGTPLGRAVGNGAPAPDPDVQARAYQLADRRLGAAGYGRYETSNWARPGHECRYNLTVWAQGEYLAFGNGAHGHRGGVRFRNLRRIDAYIEAVERGETPRVGEETASGWASEIERLFVGLRRTVGVVPGSGGVALLAAPEGERLSQAGVIEVREGRLRVAKPLLGDEAMRAVLGLADPEVRENAASADTVSLDA